MVVLKHILILLVLVGVVTGEEIPTIQFSSDFISKPEKNQFFYGDFPQIAVGTEILLSAQTRYIELNYEEDITDIGFTILQSNYIDKLNCVEFTDETTGNNDIYNQISPPVPLEKFGTQPIFVEGIVQDGLSRYVRLLVFPVTVRSDGTVILNSTLQIFAGNRLISPEQLLDNIPSANHQTYKENYNRIATSDGSTRYVIITSRDLADVFQVLAGYRTSIGISAEVKIIDDILSTYSGCDDAEKLREYLKQFYSDGGEYVLLAGDETVLPIRYAYHLSVDEEPSREVTQICDLYFADLTGEWDIDNDGIWGETGDDQPDLEPELLVGRLPFNNAAEATNYINKLITYETNPGYGDMEYLARSFFFSSDQMRDYSNGGQHARVAQAYPGEISIDTVNGVEASSGVDIAPFNSSAFDLVPLISEGFGIVNIIAHGRTDGFAVKTSGYNNWPKSYFLSEAEGSDHGAFMTLTSNGRPGLYYSLACDNGAFDMDQAPWELPNLNVVQNLLGLNDAGAVAFVANSRWGWISTSYLLQVTFFDSLFAHPELPAVDAMYASKAVYYYYRDLVYGQNFYGDPALKIYTRLPDQLTIDSTLLERQIELQVMSNGEPVSQAEVLVYTDDNQTCSYLTDDEGILHLDAPASSEEVIVSAILEGHTVGRLVLSPTIVTTVEDTETELPGTFQLNQNYPNPFNPTTTISFKLSHPEHVTLTIFNVLGRKVRTLLDTELAGGEHQVTFDGLNDDGGSIASGIYLYRLITDNNHNVKKMVLLR